MRHDTRSTRSAASRRVLTAGMPAVIAGSIALTLTGAPAHAADGSMPRPQTAPDVPAPRLHAAALRVVASLIPDSVTVQSGDTVSAIAARNGLRTADVLALNGLTADSTIFPGQVLSLTGAPAASAAPAPQAAPGYVIEAGDTISAIAQAHGVTTQAVLDANGLSRASIIYPGQTIAIPGTMVTASATAAAPVAPATPVAPPAPVASTGPSYVIQAGDTISAIARAHGVSTQAVLDTNGLSPASIIYPGQTIAIPGAAPASAPPASASPTTAGLDAEQAANAVLIIGIGRELGVPEKGIAIALGTAMQESWLRNLDWGDRDSLGLFQQRPSTGWGTPDEVRDPARATRAFFGGVADPNGSRTQGLLDIPGWDGMSFAQAAQAVQISAYPDRYAEWEQPAWAWLADLG